MNQKESNKQFIIIGMITVIILVILYFLFSKKNKTESKYKSGFTQKQIKNPISTDILYQNCMNFCVGSGGTEYACDFHCSPLKQYEIDDDITLRKRH